MLQIDDLRSKLDELRVMRLLSRQEYAELSEIISDLGNPAVSEEVRAQLLDKLRASPLGLWLAERR